MLERFYRAARATTRHRGRHQRAGQPRRRRSPSCASYPTGYPQLRSVGDERSAAFGSTGVPENFLVDPRGRLALIWRGPVDDRFLREQRRAADRRPRSEARGALAVARRSALLAAGARRRPSPRRAADDRQRRRRRGDVPDLRHPARAGRIAAGAAREGLRRQADRRRQDQGRDQGRPRRPVRAARCWRCRRPPASTSPPTWCRSIAFLLAVVALALQRRALAPRRRARRGREATPRRGPQGEDAERLEADLARYDL